MIMKWYGAIGSFRLNSIQLKKQKNFKIVKTSKIHLTRNAKIGLFTYTTHFPSIWSITLFSRRDASHNSLTQSLFLYSNTYFFFLPLPKYLLKYTFNLELNTLLIYFFYKNLFLGPFYKTLKFVYYQFTNIFFKKIKFKGKGYYAFKNFRNVFALQFGYSHIIRLYFYHCYVKFLTKTIIFLFGINFLAFNKQSFNFFAVKPINIFTNRGIRFSKQIIYKKTGKISSYR